MARSLDQKIFDAKTPSAKSQLQAQQKQHETEQRQWLLKAVDSYVKAANYRKYERMDEVLFRLAYLLQTIGKEEQAREFFLRLIKDYPNSKYIPNAYLSFAQFYFDKGEMDAAKKFYEKVEQFPKSDVYGYAIYKKGWCYINLGDFKTALGTFVEVIKLAQAGKAANNKLGNASLEREAKKDVVKAYARTPGAGPDRAWDFFTRVGGDFAPKMMEALAELYWEQGMFPRLDQGLSQADGPEPRVGPPVRVAEQGGSQHPVGRHQEGSGPGDQPAGDRLRPGQGAAHRQEGSGGRSAGCRSTTSARSWRWSGTRRPSAPRTPTPTCW